MSAHISFIGGRWFESSSHHVTAESPLAIPIDRGTSRPVSQALIVAGAPTVWCMRRGGNIVDMLVGLCTGRPAS